ncbi:FAD-binding oxidoreductase [Reinekea sp. G2M2-21]|uniref:NAD(P)/FAD-dependent oxidoreductase n=1 Tax=Reinekea sp. G2M2-21 TaxID=2788942 RepID=UPI0018A96AEB|nr:FAD-dependent oxidoreductase [Reinekea sp. G2M2-21]
MGTSTPVHTHQHVIIGAGIIGLMTAWHLQQAGKKVLLIDRVLPGDRNQTSYGNAGVLSFASFRPIAEPGAWQQGLQGLLKPNSALKIRWRYLPTLSPWLWAFLKESRRDKADANASAILALNNHSKTCWQSARQTLQLSDLVEATGWIKLFESDAAFQAQLKQTPLLDSAGLGWQALTGHEVRDLEPEIGPAIQHGFWQKDSLFLRQPHHVIQRLAEVIRERGGEFRQENVQALQKTQEGLTIHMQHQSLAATQVSLCAGAFSQRLLATVGDNVPLETERGYHIMMPGCDTLTRPIMHVEKQIVVSPMLEGLRMTTGEELAGLDAPADYRMIQRKHKLLTALLPKLDRTIKTQWLGFRPSLPDSKPIIGRHPRIQGLTMAFGHGHLGMTQSAATGELMSQIILGMDTAIDTEPFSFARFGNTRQ